LEHIYIYTSTELGHRLELNLYGVTFGVEKLSVLIAVVPIPNVLPFLLCVTVTISLPIQAPKVSRHIQLGVGPLGQISNLANSRQRSDAAISTTVAPERVSRRLARLEDLQ